MVYRANPGGTLPPSQIYDRDELIARLWRTLEQQSVYLTSERRMGKTSVVSKMHAAPPDGVEVVSCDLEKVGSPAQLVEALLLAIHDKSPRLLRARGWLRRQLEALGITKLSIPAVGSVELRREVEPRWEAALDRVLQSLQRLETQRVVVFLDEVAYGLDKMAKATSARDAREVLDRLRAARQEDSRVRMVFASSVGLHHVLAELGVDAGSWAPTNDVAIVDVGPFSPADAVGLARALLEGEELGDPGGVASAVAAAADGVPFYVHHIVRQLLDHDGPPGPDAVEEVVERGLADPQDSWGFDHYVTRLDAYYGDDAPLVADILDLIALSGPLRFGELLRLLAARREVYERDREPIRRLLDLLQKDHYLVLAPDDTFRFRLRLIARAWVVRRHLDEP